MKTFESDETRKERNEFSRAKWVSESRRRGKKQAIVTSQERFLATMVANLRSARVERCQAKNGCDEPHWDRKVSFFYV